MHTAETQNSAAAARAALGPTRLGVLVFVAAAAAGPLYAVDGYAPLRDLISELAAQRTPNNGIMMAAFVLFGAAVVFDGARTFGARQVPFMLFGLFMGLAGLFGHRPADPTLTYATWAHAAHSALATAAGVSITAGFVWQAVVRREAAERLAAAALAVVCVAVPLAMLRFPDVQGAAQRTMYLAVFAWLWFRYPLGAQLAGEGTPHAAVAAPIPGVAPSVSAPLPGSIDARIERFLALPAVAVVGVSDTRDSGCNLVWKKLKSGSRRLYPVHPRQSEYDGVRCAPSLAELPEVPAGVFIMVRPEASLAIVEEAVALGVKSVWMHCMLGTRPGLMANGTSVSAAAVALCEANGVEVIPGSCPAQFIDPDGFHRFVQRASRGFGLMQ